MQMMQDITRNVLVMVGSVLISSIVVILIVIALFYLFKTQFTPAKISSFFFG